MNRSDPATILAPPKRQGAVVRERLLAVVQSSDAPIVAIVAPAGYGKTTLMAQLARAEDRPVVWMALHRRDDDATTLVRHLSAAFSAAGGRTSRQRRLATGASRTWPAASHVDRIMADLAPFALYLDDVDSVSDAESACVIRAVAERLPPGSRLTMASRSEPPIALARERGMGTLLELDRARLAFDDAEALAFARGFGDGITRESVVALGRRAEGWVTGMVLGVQAARSTGAAGVVIEAFGGDDRFITDYLETEALAGLSDEERAFLRRTAFLDRLSGPLCDVVLERTGSSSVLEAMERAGRFLVPLDHRREWYRHHGWLRAMLRTQLDRAEGDTIPPLAGRAAAWLEHHALAGDALEMACLAGETQLVARLLLTHGQAMLESGESERLLRCMAWFEGSGALREHPATALAGTWLLARAGDGAAARRWFETVPDIAIDQAAAGSDAVAPPRALVRCALAQDGVARMLADARTACEQVPDDSPWRAEALCLLGVGLGLTGAWDESTAALDAAIEASGRTQALTRAIALAVRGLAALRYGDRHAAAADSMDARDALARAGLADAPASVVVDALAARIALVHGDHGRARDEIEHARRRRWETRPGLPWLVAHARIELARASLGLGDIAGARSLLREVDGLFRRIPPLGTLRADAWDVTRQADTRSLAAQRMTALTAAESRLLPFLSTHLTFPEIADRLVLSQNTIKSQVMSIYRKLDATSRTTAVDRARSLGLVEGGVDIMGPDRADTVSDARARLLVVASS